MQPPTECLYSLHNNVLLAAMFADGELRLGFKAGDTMAPSVRAAVLKASVTELEDEIRRETDPKRRNAMMKVWRALCAMRLGEAANAN